MTRVVPKNNRHMPRGVTLLETLLVVSLMGIAATMALASARTSSVGLLQSASRIVAADLNNARQLAVANNSSYSLAFQCDADAYTLQHSGVNPNLNNLPASPFGGYDSPTQQTTTLPNLPYLQDVDIKVLCNVVGSTRYTATQLDYNSLGALNSGYPTEVWLATKSAPVQYVCLAIDPVTGLVSQGDVSASLPSVSTSPPPRTSGGGTSGQSSGGTTITAAASLGSTTTAAKVSTTSSTLTAQSSTSSSTAKLDFGLGLQSLFAR